MPRSAASKVAWVGRSASMVLMLAAVLAGCSGADAGSGTQGEQAKATSAAPPEAEDDNAATSEGREVMIEMVANDSGRSLEIDRVKPGNAHGDIICDAEIETGKIRSCAYTPTRGFTGTDRFEYTVKDANGKTDTAMVYVEVKPANQLE
jgi:large repetitive protein